MLTHPNLVVSLGFSNVSGVAATAREFVHQRGANMWRDDVLKLKQVTNFNASFKDNFKVCVRVVVRKQFLSILTLQY